jgi:HAD superfamily hydrolase (TIGR01509 family)
MFKNIIFDWSGVIKDAIDAHLWVVNCMMKEFGGKEISLEEFKENWEEPYMEFWKKYYPELKIEEENKVYTKFVLSESCPKSNASVGIVELIKKIKQKGLLMIVLSSDLPETVFPEVEGFHLGGTFAEIITNVHDKKGRIHELITKYNFKPEETIFVGDSANEVKAGKSAGIKTASVTWGLYSEKKLKLGKPDYLAHNIQELEKILLK